MSDTHAEREVEVIGIGFTQAHDALDRGTSGTLIQEARCYTNNILDSRSVLLAQLTKKFVHKYLQSRVKTDI